MVVGMSIKETEERQRRLLEEFEERLKAGRMAKPDEVLEPLDHFVATSVRGGGSTNTGPR